MGLCLTAVQGGQIAVLDHLTTEVVKCNSVHYVAYEEKALEIS